jgi:dipeptidyl aminopeptidase/acylaminoacyl peptidase
VLSAFSHQVVRKDSSHCRWAALFVVAFAAVVSAQESRPGSVTVDDLVARVQIRRISLSPDGRWVALLAVRGVLQENRYEVEIDLLSMHRTGGPLSLAHYPLRPVDTFESDSGSIQKSAGEMVWSPDSTELAYTTHQEKGMELRIRSILTASEKVLLRGFEKIEISRKEMELEILAVQPYVAETEAETEPIDLGLLVKDTDRFYTSLRNPRPSGKYEFAHGEYEWGSRAAVITQWKEPSYMGFRDESGTDDLTTRAEHKSSGWPRSAVRGQFVSPDGNLVIALENKSSDATNSTLPRRTSEIVLRPAKGKKAEGRVLVAPTRPSSLYTILGWSPDSREVYYLRLGAQSSSLNAVDVAGNIREIHREEAGLFAPDAASEISFEKSTIVAVRNTNVTPDELVKIDLKTGESTTLFSPNESFLKKSLPTVRFMKIDCCDADFYGRLYLPAEYQEGKRYPLVFTNYLSSPGFYAAVGDEIPILALTAHEIAVFAMNSRDSNVVSQKGDFHSEIARVARPLRAMEWVRRKLSEDGIIDPERCGLTGLSYGAEIAMYAEWNSKMFRAVSAASGSWEPMNYVLGGLVFAKFLDSRGFAIPGEASIPQWKELSLGLNARSDFPPLLLQTSDAEEHFGTPETWFRLRRAGAAVEWYEYPDEGHVKRSPSTKWWVYERNLDWFLFWLKGEELSSESRSEQYARWRQMRDTTRRFIPPGTRQPLQGP